MKRLKKGKSSLFPDFKRYFCQKEFWCLIFSLLAMTAIFYAPWLQWLEKLDEKPLVVQAIKGNPVFTQKEDIDEVLHKMGGLKGYFGQNVHQISEQIQQLPWIEKVIARKKWPNQLFLWVTDYLPVAKWNENYYLSKDGVIFSLPTTKLSAVNLPQLSGMTENIPQIMKTWQQMFSILKAQDLTLSALHLADRGSWTATLNNGIVLKLGRSDWQQKLSHLVLIYPTIEVPAHQSIAYIDLRYPTGAAVKFVAQETRQKEKR